MSVHFEAHTVERERPCGKRWREKEGVKSHCENISEELRSERGEGGEERNLHIFLFLGKRRGGREGWEFGKVVF